MKKPFSTENITTLISKATEITGDCTLQRGVWKLKEKSVAISMLMTILLLKFGSGKAVLFRVKSRCLPSSSMAWSREMSIQRSIWSWRRKPELWVMFTTTLIEMVMGSEVNGSLCHRASADLKPRQLGSREV